MKKIIKTSLFLAALLSASIMTTNAKTMTAEQLNNLVTIKVGSQNLSQNLYIYGKYVFVNTITSAELNDAMNDLLDDVDYAKSYRELFKDNVAALIHKDSNNNWENLTYGGSLAKKASIEMTHLIGDLTGEHISNADVYDGTYIKQEKLPSNRTAEIFVDQMAKLNIADIKATDGKGTLASPISTDTHAHNTKALEVNFSKNILKLNEKMPLLKYNNGTDNAKWVGLIIKTNKALTKNDKITFNGADYTTNEAGIQKLVSASEHGGDASDYIIWLDADVLKTEPNVTVSVKNDKGTYEVAQTIKLEYTAIKASFTDEITATEGGSTPVVATNRDSVNSAVAKINDKYVVLFYTDDTKVTQVEYTIDGDKKVAKKTSAYVWPTTDLIQVLDVEKNTISSPTNNQKWNQEAITSISTPEIHTYTEKEQYDYVVNVYYNKGLKDLKTTGIKINVDLSVGAGYIEELRNVTNTTKWIVTLNEKETIVNFVNNKIANDKDKVAIKFVLVDETPEMTVNVTEGAEVDLYKNPTQTQSGINGNYKYNLQNINLTTNKLDNGYNDYEVILQQVNRENALAKFNATTANAGDTAGKSIIGVIVDFGDVALSNISAQTVTNEHKDNESLANYPLEKAKNIDVAKYYSGETAGENAIVLWIYDDITIRFTNSETNASVDVKFDLRTIKPDYITYGNNDLSNVTSIVIDSEYADVVKYANNGNFIVNDGVTKFVAKTTTSVDGVTKTADYTYVIEGNKAYKLQNLELTRVFAIEKSSDTNTKYIFDSVKDVTFKGNTIEVTLNKNIKGRYALALDFGIGAAARAIYGSDDSNTAGLLPVVTDGRFEKNPENMNNLVLIWVDAERSGSEEGADFEFVHRGSSESKSSIPYKIVVKSKVENEQPELELKSEEKVVIDSNIIGTDLYNKMKNNFEATSVREEDGRIVISYKKELTTYNNDKNSTPGKWFGILVDLGVDPSYLEGDIYTINPEDVSDATKFGGKENSTQFIIWLRQEDFESSKAKAETDEYGELTGRKILTITFKNNSNSNDKFAEPITLEFVLEDAREKLEIKSIEELSTTTDVKVNDVELFKLNQERFESSYDFENNTITVRPTLEDNEFVSYKSADDSEVTLANGEWYAVQVDFGKDVNLRYGYDNVKLQKVEGSTKSILWINSAVMTGAQATFVDAYNGMEYVMTFKLSK